MVPQLSCLKCKSRLVSQKQEIIGKALGFENKKKTISKNKKIIDYLKRKTLILKSRKASLIRIKKLNKQMQSILYTNYHQKKLLIKKKTFFLFYFFI